MGAMYLTRGLGFRGERLGALVNWEESRRIGHQEPASGVAPFSPRITQAPYDSLTVMEARQSRLPTALWLARSDQTVRGILMTLGLEGISYRSLYAVRDFLIEAGLTDADIQTASGSSSAQMKAFTRTANSYAAVGPEARHGLTRAEPPATPASLEDGAQVILPAARQLVDQRALAALAVK